MILDAYLQFDPTGTPITVTAPSTNVLDMINARDMGVGEEELQLVIYTQAAFAAAGAATLNIQLQTSADNATWFTSEESGPIAVALMTANTKLWQTFINHRSTAQGNNPFPRYYRLNYVVATGPFTAGTLSANMPVDTSSSPAYPSGVVIYN